MQKSFLVLIVAAIALMAAWASSASAEDKCSNSNPCADKESCVRLGDLDKECRRICCNDEQCSGEVCYRGYCVSEDEKSQLEKYYAKAAASANAKAAKDARKALDEADAALKAAKGDAEKVRLALIQVLKAEYRLADLDLTLARVESGEATKTWLSLTTEATRDGAGDLHAKWDTLKTKREILEGKISALTGAMATANGLISAQPANAKLETIQDSLTDLQFAHGNLKVALSDLQSAHKAILGEQERNFATELDAERENTRKAKAEATGLRPHEVSVLVFFLNVLETERMEDDRAQTAWGRLVYHYNFRLKNAWRPFVGGGVEAGALLDGRGYVGPVAELGFRIGDPSKAFFFEMFIDGGYRVGFYKGSGDAPFFGVGLGPGFNISNKGMVMFGACYSSTSPGFNGHKAGFEDNILGICLRGGPTAGDPE